MATPVLSASALGTVPSNVLGGSGAHLLALPSQHPPGAGVSATCDHFMLMHVEQLARTLTTLSGTVQGIEARQTGLDERLTELCGTVQGVQEEHSTLQCRQDMVAQMVQQQRKEEGLDGGFPLSIALDGRPPAPAGEAARAGEVRLDEHERRLTKLSVDVTLLASKVAGNVLDLNGPRVSKESNALAERLQELEQGQKKVLAGAQKALKMAMGLHLEQRNQLQQQESLDKLLADSICQPHVLPAPSPDGAVNGELAQRLDEQDRAVSELRRGFEGLDGLREQVDELQHAVVFSLASQQPPPSGGRAPLSDAATPSGSHFGEVAGGSDRLVAMVQAVQARVDRNLADLSRRLDALQEAKEHHRLEGWQFSRQVPDIAKKMDQIWTQCQYYFSKVKEHDVQLNFMCNSFESKQLLALDMPQRDDPMPKLGDLGGAAPTTTGSPRSTGAPASESSAPAPPSPGGGLGPLAGLSWRGHAGIPGQTYAAPATPPAAFATPPAALASLVAGAGAPTPLAAPSTPVRGGAGARVAEEIATRNRAEDNDDGLELFGSSSIFNETRSPFKARSSPCARAETRPLNLRGTEGLTS